VEIGGYYGPFVDADDWWTGPLPKRTLGERAVDEAYLGFVDLLAKPPVNAATLDLVRVLFPEFGRDPLVASFDSCLPTAEGGGA